MTKIICTSLQAGILESAKYTGPSGTEYEFRKSHPTEVSDNDDASYFLKAGNGTLFQDAGMVATTVRKVKEKVKETVTGEAPKKEEVRKSANELNTQKEKKAEKEAKKAGNLTEKEAYKLNATEQRALIKKLDPTASIPRYEKDRVALILKLQK